MGHQGRRLQCERSAQTLQHVWVQLPILLIPYKVGSRSRIISLFHYSKLKPNWRECYTISIIKSIMQLQPYHPYMYYIPTSVAISYLHCNLIQSNDIGQPTLFITNCFLF